MNNEKVREIIAKNNEIISRLVNLECWTLNKEVVQLMEENKKLQDECTHEFNEKGVCIYCDKNKTE